MSVKLDRRLTRCAGYVTPGGVTLDVGTDHAYLPCYLVSEGVSRRALASDISASALGFALRTVEKYSLGDKVLLFCSDGLKDIPSDVLSEVTDIVISGMGGELIAKILEDRDRLPEDINLVLQPNTRSAVLREYLYRNGFEIVCESAVRDGKFFYPIINAKSGDSRELSPLEAHVGKLDPREDEARGFLEHEITRLLEASDGLLGASDPNKRQQAEKLRKLAEEIKAYISQEGV